MTTKTASLYFNEGSSNKEYHVQLEESNGGFVVNFQYGRVGNALQVGTKTPSPVSLVEADKIYSKLLKEKIGKGYSEGDKKNDFYQTSQQSKETVLVFPQLLNSTDNAQEYINNKNYISQMKFDGERRLIVSTKTNITGINKKGASVSLPCSIEKSVLIECIIDGEIIGEKLYAFDILSLNNKSLKETKLIDRIKALEEIKFGSAIEVIKTAYTTEEKQKMYEELKKNNAEGIVFKKKESKYVAGRPASGGDQIKNKFQKSGTFIVKNKTTGKRSIGLELISNGEKIFMGKVTIPQNHNIPDVGSFVEVRYLYCFPNGCLAQPCYLGERTDCDETDVSIKQIVYKS